MGYLYGDELKIIEWVNYFLGWGQVKEDTEEEMVEEPAEDVKEEPAEEFVKSPFYKTALCQRKNCSESLCPYAHQTSEVRNVSMNLIVMRSSPVWKTTMCSRSNCPLGSHCNYSHCKEDLRSTEEELVLALKNNPYFL